MQNKFKIWRALRTLTKFPFLKNLKVKNEIHNIFSTQWPNLVSRRTHFLRLSVHRIRWAVPRASDHFFASITRRKPIQSRLSTEQKHDTLGLLENKKSRLRKGFCFSADDGRSQTQRKPCRVAIMSKTPVSQ